MPAKTDYDGLVRQAVLGRILEDALNVERTRQAMQRDFLLKLPEGFVYDCLRWKVAQLELAPYRQMIRQRFSGTLCVDACRIAPAARPRIARCRTRMSCVLWVG